MHSLVTSLALAAAVFSPGSGLAQSPQILAASRWETSRSILMSPLRSEGTERLLVLLPGARKPAAEYESLARRIQETSSLRLWIVIPKFFLETPNPIQIGGVMDDVYHDVKNAGFDAKPETTFLAGHSMGGIAAQGYAKKTGMAGLVLLASYLTRTSDGQSGLLSYGLPVLTLGGELDGQTRLPRLAGEAEVALTQLASNDARAVATRMPVVILPKINHSQFAGTVQMPKDLLPEVSYDEAQSQIAQVVSDFLILNSETGAETLPASERILSAMNVTRRLVDGTLSLRNEDKVWCAELQQNVFGSVGRGVSVREQPLDSVTEFAGSKPEISRDSNGTLTVNVTSRRKYAFNPMDISTNPESSQETSCKLKSREALEATMELPASGPAQSCADLNQLAVQQAATRLTPEAAARFAAKGIPFRFEDDNRLGAGILWLPAALELKVEEEGGARHLSVRSPSLFTSLDAPERFAGMNYCKVISPAQALEWMLVDGLRP